MRHLIIFLFIIFSKSSFSERCSYSDIDRNNRVFNLDGHIYHINFSAHIGGNLTERRKDFAKKFCKDTATTARNIHLLDLNAFELIIEQQIELKDLEKSLRRGEIEMIGVESASDSSKSYENFNTFNSFDSDVGLAKNLIKCIKKGPLVDKALKSFRVESVDNLLLYIFQPDVVAKARSEIAGHDYFDNIRVAPVDSISEKRDQYEGSMYNINNKIDFLLELDLSQEQRSTLHKLGVHTSDFDKRYRLSEGDKKNLLGTPPKKGIARILEELETEVDFLERLLKSRDMDMASNLLSYKYPSSYVSLGMIHKKGVTSHLMEQCQLATASPQSSQAQDQSKVIRANAD